MHWRDDMPSTPGTRGDLMGTLMGILICLFLVIYGILGFMAISKDTKARSSHGPSEDDWGFYDSQDYEYVLKNNDTPEERR